MNLEETIRNLAIDFAHKLLAGITAELTSALSGVAVGQPAAQPAKKHRKGRVWPKCPVCGENAWPKGKGYCREHDKAATAKPKKKAVKKPVATKKLPKKTMTAKKVAKRPAKAEKRVTARRPKLPTVIASFAPPPAETESAT